MKKINSIVDIVLARLGLLEPVMRMTALEAWAEVVGEEIASRTKALRLSNNTLVVSVPEAALRNELALRKVQLIKKYHQLGYGFIREIKFVR